jgi:putative ubiquitin-RnfH superfamily antitoxin RatB of RatAB toxin-antitoxin module
MLLCELELPDDATIAMALDIARHQLGDAAADWAHAATGIYGRALGRDYIPVNGDRIELYRALKVDPRAQRRARAARATREARANPKPKRRQ